MADWVVVALAVCTVVSYLVNRSVLNPVTISLALFTLISFLANLHLYGLLPFSDIAYEIILAGCLSILFGSIMARLLHATSMRSQSTTQRRSQARWRISYRFINYSLGVAILTIVGTRWKSILILTSGGTLGDVRNSYLGYDGRSENLASLGLLLERVVVSPILFAALPIFVLGLVEGQHNRRFNRLFVAALALNLATSGGRVIFVCAVVQLIVLLALDGRLRVRVSKGRVVAMVLASIVLVAWVTSSRGNALMYEAYTYLAIPLPLLAHWSSVADEQSLSTGGAGFLYGIVTLAANGAGLFGGSLAQSTTEAVNQPQDTWIELLPGQPFNAFVTLFYYFYLDFRIPGVVLFSALYGSFMQTVYDRARTFGGLLPKLLLLLVMQSVVMSFVRWQPTDGAYVLAFVVLLAAIRRSKGEGPEPYSNDGRSLKRTARSKVL